MRWKWATKVGMFIQKDGLPKAIHLFQMLGPSVLDAFLKNWSKKTVLTDSAVKLID